MYVSDFNGTLVAIKQLKMDKSADVDHMNEIKALRFAYYYAFHFIRCLYNFIYIYIYLVLFTIPILCCLWDTHTRTTAYKSSQILWKETICFIYYLRRYV